MYVICNIDRDGGEDIQLGEVYKVHSMHDNNGQKVKTWGEADKLFVEKPDSVCLYGVDASQLYPCRVSEHELELIEQKTVQYMEETYTVKSDIRRVKSGEPFTVRFGLVEKGDRNQTVDYSSGTICTIAQYILVVLLHCTYDNATIYACATPNYQINRIVEYNILQWKHLQETLERDKIEKKIEFYEDLKNINYVS